jgi:stress response protein YsnF
MASTVVGFFDSNEEAQNAVEQLIDQGFDRSDVDISSGANAATMQATTDGNTNNEENQSGISKFFKNLFGNDDDEADRYTTVGSRSNTIVTVHAQTADDAERAADLLDDYGAIDVNERATEYGFTPGNMDAGANYAVDPAATTDYTNTSNTAANYAATTDAGTTTGANLSTNSDEVIPVVKENLEVGKRTVQTGGVRVRSRIVERPVQESIRLREEQVRIETHTC